MQGRNEEGRAFYLLLRTSTVNLGLCRPCRHHQQNNGAPRHCRLHITSTHRGLADSESSAENASHVFEPVA